ncbi:MAG: helix-turn-helix domain-containing protein [Spirochaetes bacterium]|nr:MAG: helix-turn-helix domain-containing protein [Spirochaetota bacterium]
MNWVSVPVLMMAAICFYVGATYLWSWSRRRAEPENLSFALTCVVIGCYNVFCAGLYNSASVEEGITWQRLQFASLCLFSISILWFASHFTGYRPRRVLALITGWMSALFVAGLALRGALTLTVDMPRPKQVSLAGLAITYYEGDPGTVYEIQYLSMAAGFVFLLWMIARHYREGGREHARPLLVALVVFFAAAMNDMLVGEDVYPFVFLIEYAYMVVIFSMAYVLQNKLITLDREVRALNLRLTEKVNERSMELLFSEIGKGLYAEILSELSAPGKSTRAARSLERLAAQDQGAGMAKLSRDLAVISNIEDLLRRAIGKAVEISSADEGFIFLAGERGGLELRSSSPGDAVPPRRAVALAGRSFREGGRIIASRGRGETRGGGSDVLAVPLRLGGEIIGAGCLVKRASSGRFAEEDERIIAAFMNQAAAALENAFLYQRMANARRPTGRTDLTPAIEEKIAKAIAYLEENYLDDVAREGLAAMLDMHPDSLGRYFKIRTGKKISDFVNELRVKEAARRLARTDENIVHIAFAAGFESIPTFNRAFHRVMGITPTEYRESAAEPRMHANKRESKNH